MKHQKLINFSAIAVALFHIIFDAILVHRSLVTLLFSTSLKSVQYNYQPALTECLQTTLNDTRVHYDDVRNIFNSFVTINVGVLVYFIAHLAASLSFFYGVKVKNYKFLRLMTFFMVMDIGIARYLSVYLRYDFWNLINHYETKMETLVDFPNQMVLPILWSVFAIFVISFYHDSKFKYETRNIVIILL